LAETGGYEPPAAERDVEAEAEITYEPLTIDVISKGQPEAEPEHAWRPESLADSVNT
jgi:hypothetical protein